MGRVAPAQVVDQEVVDQEAEVREVQVRAVEVRAVEAQVAEAQVVEAREEARVAVAPVEAGRMEVRQRLACGPELAATALRLFLEWWPAWPGDPLAGAASRQKKSFSGFLAR